MNILLVTSSIFGDQSKSREVALEFIDGWRAAHGSSELVVRDTNAIPHFSGAMLQAFMTPAEQRDATQNAAIAAADAIIAEAEAADVIVIAAPMYNFAIASTLKAWIDYLTRAGRTFRYTANGPEGFLKNKKVFVITSRGGYYINTATDFQEPYLRHVLGFVGLTDVTFIHTEGLAMGPEAAAAGLSAAKAQAAQTVRAQPPAQNMAA